VRRIILASASPRRAALLRQIGLDFEVMVSGVDENVSGKSPEVVVTALSRAKARDVCAKVVGDAVVIGADTVVAPPGGGILGKPRDAGEARRMLGRLANVWHSVCTGVTIIGKADGREESFLDVTRVYLRFEDEAEIAAYAATGEPLDKAGAYGVQGKAAAFVGGIDGDYSSVAGLPLNRLCRELRKFGVSVAGRWAWNSDKGLDKNNALIYHQDNSPPADGSSSSGGESPRIREK
jgi:septum formation protein